ncbi:6-phosphogluconolactonase [Paracoccus niistensis]|uniref:6-phosphogluconolactonase n=1 Tax=Paracoccus niistensis TaxID=632935 RepID=A0ABV6I1Y9_9RHOB
MTLTEHPDREALTLAVAQAITEALGMALKVRERAVLCLPGGSTPVPVFKALAAARLEWERVIVIPSDERWVPADHPRSNARLIRRNLLEEGAGAELIELYTEGLDPQAGAALASERIAPLLPLSVLLLGMGEDMHTASLIPGADGLEAALDSAAPPVLPVQTAAEARVTLTVPALCSATEAFLMITGPEKREALERAAALPVEEAPVRAVLKGLMVHYAE